MYIESRYNNWEFDGCCFYGNGIFSHDNNKHSTKKLKFGVFWNKEVDAEYMHIKNTF